MKIKKNILLLSGLVLSVFTSAGQQTYRISGQLPGIPDGAKVYLGDLFDQGAGMLDSAVTKDGVFTMTGKARWETARLCNLRIDPQPGDIKKSKLVPLFMGNETVHIAASHIDSVPGYYFPGGSMKYVQITGAAEQTLYKTFETANKQLSDRITVLSGQYEHTYEIPARGGIFNTAKGMALARDITAAQQALGARKRAFVREHPQTVVAAYFVYELLLSANSKYTISEIDAIAGSLDTAALATSALLKAIRLVAANEKIIAKGVRFTDIPLIDPQGQPVQLARYVKPGQYNMLEFWASWCGPCRAEIPHLRYLNKVISEKDFHIISISMDEKKTDWDKAMVEEKMVWTQLCDNKGFKGPVTGHYKVRAIPFSIVLDKQGKIVASKARGAELDAVLKDLLGERISAF
ncbi:TlpA disulfide reductase family protein [Chitinophaga qingshengii]|uniref:AhpC/TSA family protein n=1 Tax=Chitinophaga qingshengii TaxID=1569794 RepID=A0ABR7TYG0_9BACT|nr:TlpA disulfide reductase family protein [Chitinophaga qingshengii]MBC9934194.1 AhpC/TSA family protein [Chitinophaga qingshengii]